MIGGPAWAAEPARSQLTVYRSVTGETRPTDPIYSMMAVQTVVTGYREITPIDRQEERLGESD